MGYRAGFIGRVLTICFDHGEDFLVGLRDVVLKEKIRSDWFQVIGALDKAGVVIGLKEPVVPPDPIWQDVDGVTELVGCGSVFNKAEKAPYPPTSRSWWVGKDFSSRLLPFLELQGDSDDGAAPLPEDEYRTGH